MALDRKQYADLEEYLAKLPVSGLETIKRLSDGQRFDDVDIATLCDMVDAELAFRNRSIDCGVIIPLDEKKPE